MHTKWSAGFLVVAMAAASATAHGFEIQSLVTTRCHERITADALSRSGWPDGQEAPEPEDTERRIIDDLAFDLPEDAEDAWIPIGADSKLIIKPGDIALPMPQIQGIPFYYHQYLFTVGLEWYP